MHVARRHVRAVGVEHIATHQAVANRLTNNLIKNQLLNISG